MTCRFASRDYRSTGLRFAEALWLMFAKFTNDNQFCASSEGKCLCLSARTTPVHLHAITLWKRSGFCFLIDPIEKHPDLLGIEIEFHTTS